MKRRLCHRSVALLGILLTLALFLAIDRDRRAYSVQKATASALLTWISGPRPLDPPPPPPPPRNASHLGSIAPDYADYEDEDAASPWQQEWEPQEVQDHQEQDKQERDSRNGQEAGDRGEALLAKTVAAPPIQKCDFYTGSWIRDETYPLFQPFTCPFVDTAFRCQENGRQDKGYLQWRWQPSGCDIPRFDPGRMLASLRKKKLAFVGDSLGRNQWESLVCMLYQGVSNRSNVFEARGQQVGKGRPSYSIRFPDYYTQIDYYRSHFLVPENRRPPGIPHRKKIKCSLLLDRMDRTAPKWKDADILVFNSGHWWNHGKIAKGRCYFVDGENYTTNMDVHDAYKRALQAWASWVESHSTKRVFFRGFAPSHFSGGDWNTGGRCEDHVQPIQDESKLDSYPDKVEPVEKILSAMKKAVTFLNVTKLTLFRKDGHVAGWGRANGGGRQDCSHWCLPGVPDTWNALLYASLMQS